MITTGEACGLRYEDCSNEELVRLMDSMLNDMYSRLAMIDKVYAEVAQRLHPYKVVSNQDGGIYGNDTGWGGTHNQPPSEWLGTKYRMLVVTERGLVPLIEVQSELDWIAFGVDVDKTRIRFAQPTQMWPEGVNGDFDNHLSDKMRVQPLGVMSSPKRSADYEYQGEDIKVWRDIRPATMQMNGGLQVFVRNTIHSVYVMPMSEFNVQGYLTAPKGELYIFIDAQHLFGESPVAINSEVSNDTRMAC